MLPRHPLHSSHPLLPPPPLSISLFFMPASPLLPCKQVHQCHLSRSHVYAWVYGICFSFSDLLHCITGSNSPTSLELTQMCSFLWLSDIPCIYVKSGHFFFFLKEYSDKHGAQTKKTSLNVRSQKSLQMKQNLKPWGWRRMSNWFQMCERLSGWE